MQAIAVCSGKVECNVSAKRMWRAACEEAHNCLPKALPQVISSMECEGRGFMRPGSLRTTRFHENYAEQFSKERHPEHVVAYIKENMMAYMKEKLQEVVGGQQAPFKLKAEVVEGGFLGDMVKRYNYTVRVEEGANPRTCVVHWSCDYEALSDQQQAQFAEALTELVPLGFAAVERYLLAHHDVCAE